MADNIKKDSEMKHTPNKQWDVHLLTCKISFFFTYAMVGSYMPFFNVFLISVGLTTTQAGLITGLRTITSVIFGPLCGALVDYTGRLKLIFVFLCLGSLTLLFPLPWIARDVCPLTFSFTGNNSSVITDRNNTSANCNEHLFYTSLSILMMSAIFDTSLLGYLDWLVMYIVSTSKKKETFGHQRMFGSLGFGVGNLLSGLVSDHYKIDGFSSYTAIFFVFLPCVLLLIPSGVFMISRGKWPHAKLSKKRDSAIFKEVIKTCSTFPNLMFLLTVLVAGLANGVYYGFLFVIMEHSMHASKTIMGLTIVVSSIAEIATFPFTSSLISTLGGPIPCIIIGVFSYFVRFLAISYIGNPWFVLLLQCLHALCFALFWAATLQHTFQISSGNIKTTMFSIVNSLHFSLGTLISNMAGGVLYEKYGGKIFFRDSSILFATWSLVMICYYFCQKYYWHRKPDKNSLLCGGINSNVIKYHSIDDKE